MMKRHPRGAARCIQKGVEDRPVGDSIRAVLHRFGLAEWRGDASGVEVVAADDDRRGQLTLCDEIVQRDAELRALAEAKPADPSRQTLEVHFLPRYRNPAGEMLVVREKLEHQLVGARDVFRIAGQSDPAERSLAFAEEG